LSTDDEADGATPSDPVETAVTSPSGGAITITESANTGAPAGFTLLGQQVSITAPAGTAANPLLIVFTLDASALPAGGVNAVTVFRNGLPVPACTGAPQAIPDPCVASRVTLGNGDGQITILTSSASLWTFGAPVTGATCDGQSVTVTGTNGKDVLFASPGDVVDARGGSDIIIVHGRGSSGVVICAGSGNDIVLGGDGPDRIFGGTGNDILAGQQGDDALFGEAGWDLLLGDGGNDAMDGGPSQDTCIGNTGTDSAVSCEKKVSVP
jgi:Ca2+-binding RTX toxin-like protein